MAKSRKPFSLQLKRQQFCNFSGPKAVWRKNYIYKPIFFLEILKAVCLSLDWVPKLIQIFFFNDGAKICSTLWDWDHCRCLQCLVCYIHQRCILFDTFGFNKKTKGVWGVSQYLILSDKRWRGEYQFPIVGLQGKRRNLDPPILSWHHLWTASL